LNRRSRPGGCDDPEPGRLILELLEEPRLEVPGPDRSRSGDQRPDLAAAHEAAATQLDALEAARASPAADRLGSKANVRRGQDLGSFAQADPVRRRGHGQSASELDDEAAGLAAQVHNFWWHGIAMMEAAATRAVHGDPAVAARALVEVLDHWDRAGDWTQQWLNLRYVVRLLVRVGADAEAAELHRCLIAAGKPSPLDDAGRCTAAKSGPALSRVEAVDLARVTLNRWV